MTAHHAHSREDLTGRVRTAVNTERATWDKSVKRIKLWLGLVVAIGAAFAGFEAWLHLFARSEDLKATNVQLLTHSERLTKIETHQDDQDKRLSEIGNNTRDILRLIRRR